MKIKTKTSYPHIITIPIYHGKKSRCINWDQSCWPIDTSFTLESHRSCIKKIRACDKRKIPSPYCENTVYSLCDGTTVKSITCAIDNLWRTCVVKIKPDKSLMSTDVGDTAHIAASIQVGGSVMEFRVWCQRRLCSSHCSWMMCWGFQSHCLLLETHTHSEINVRSSRVTWQRVIVSHFI